MSQSNISEPVMIPAYMGRDHRVSDLPRSDSRYILASFNNLNELYDLSLEAIFDNHGCVSDLRETG